MNCGKLYFTLERKANPYEEDQLNGLWGSIQINYEYLGLTENILDWEWDINEVIEWFDEAEGILAIKNLNVLNDGNKSIAELRNLGYERFFFFSEDEQYLYYKELEECFSDYKFHLRGTPTQIYYIGLNNGEGELSYFCREQKVYKRYCFNMDEFLESTKETLLNFR
ncbi:hypothetical protein [Sphingobacterium sp. HMA12]|uniref:hypothetical protein n=1 Tax=Sphingobacterium sp. HMA12 TaxID=2050894 RepID=UPI000CE9AE42|nr:hypothetical protein [Sphingobacterium sp. HMA12]